LFDHVASYDYLAVDETLHMIILGNFQPIWC